MRTTRELDPEIVRQTMRGYAEVNRITDAERRARLETITVEESLRQFSDLYETWNQTGAEAGGDIEALAQLRLEHHLVVRRAFYEYFVKTRLKDGGNLPT